MGAFPKFDPFAEINYLDVPPAKPAKVAKVDTGLAGLATLATPHPRKGDFPDGSKPDDPASWDAARWSAYFRERIEVADGEHGLPPAQAQELAYRGTAIKWLNAHPPEDFGSRASCVICLKPIPEGEDLPFLTPQGPVWLHRVECHERWIESRWKEAQSAFEKMGLPVESEFQTRRIGVSLR